MSNPYTTTPGKIPLLSYIARPRQIDDIVDEFQEEYPSNQIYKIVGIRGTGKTVALREIGKELEASGNWIVCNLNVEGDLISEFYDHIVNASYSKKILSGTKVSAGNFVKVELSKKDDITLTNEIRTLLDKIKGKGKRVLITIDEVFDSNSLRFFISQCQIWVGEEYPIFLLTAGLEHNYDEICANRNMTFFKRAPRKELYFLDLNRVVDDYAEKFHLSEIEAEKMAIITNGYAYAFQLLGYICWKENKSYEEVLSIFDKEIDNNAYQLIWSELSSGDKRTLISIAKCETNKVKDIKVICGCSSQSFQQSKERLISRKLIKNPEFGVVKFTLPRFREFVLRAERLYG